MNILDKIDEYLGDSENDEEVDEVIRRSMSQRLKAHQKKHNVKPGHPAVNHIQHIGHPVQHHKPWDGKTK